MKWLEIILWFYISSVVLSAVMIAIMFDFFEDAIYDRVIKDGKKPTILVLLWYSFIMLTPPIMLPLLNTFTGSALVFSYVYIKVLKYIINKTK